MAGLSIKDVHKNYGSVPVLKGINIEVAEGEFLILVGSSGCGKSTLLNMIAGLESITTGEIRIGGRVVNDLPPKSRDIAMVFQSYALYPSMTVRENISFGLEIRKVPAEEQKRIVNSVAESLQITHLLDRKPRQLSGGQRQRVAMGRALARDPTLFLFDEPLSNLDAQLRIEMRSEIKLMHQRTGKTICYVTHDQVEAMTLGDRIAVMKDGVVQQLGRPQEVYDSPSNMYVASFIGAPPMNFIPGKLEMAGERLAMRLETGAESGLLMLPFQLDTVSARPGDDIILGIRPERLTSKVGKEADGSAMQRLNVLVDIIEPTGPDTLVFATLNGKRTLCRVQPDIAPAVGDRLPIDFDLSLALLFDPASGKRLDAGRT
ncbi:sn-glycerol-3-phosphate ABC transporter ATP-binding protein UgpC [Aureimonas fodinaquatilis]|uniref:sn-glycerol-3-phosphate ABC transporter ATP-binding protein UgpC n=1 Tax=Aureimonas fodinaquatilis TaxID=2565783 RepID=A0A5B0DTL2_9HYPH|nr:sn-glycerol-3-phosphate ABC transporter ATP-binding protein UgpC [Aureimonas fodinaquatilis]KAA0970157.1 sn-glycerol-3-phosphate ABC transporter ATP-binding protein UgpC [Aureimonas fodinaquatilis]